MAWYDPSWPYRALLTVDNTKVGGDLTDFPVYLDLSQAGTGHGLWASVKSDGGDIRITKSDGTTEVAREIVVIDTTGKTGEVHFQADGTLSGSSDTDYYIYYGNSGASDYATSGTYGAENVWDSNHKAVWHLQESSAESVVDSTSNSVDEGSASSSATDTDGIVERGFDLNGSTDGIIFDGTSASNNLQPASAVQFEMWFNPDSLSNQVLWANFINSTNVGTGFWFWNSNFRAQIGTSGWTNLTYANTNFSTGTWYYAVGNWDGSDYKLYIDGVERDTGAYTGSQTYFGSQSILGNRGGLDDFNGQIDEVRFHDTARSANWISTTFNMMDDPANFITWGSEETDAVAFTPRGSIVI
jgi:hypothetical protein